MNKLKLSLGFRLSTSFLYFHVILEPQTKLRSSSSQASLTLSVISVLVQWHHPLSTSKHPIFLLALTSSDIQSLKNSLIPHKFLSLCAAIYSEPLSSFLTYCNNLQIPFSVAPFHQPLPIFSHWYNERSFSSVICSGLSSSQMCMASNGCLA